MGIAVVPEGGKVFKNVCRRQPAMGSYTKARQNKDKVLKSVYELSCIRTNNKLPAGSLSGGQRQRWLQLEEL